MVRSGAPVPWEEAEGGVFRLAAGAPDSSTPSAYKEVTRKMEPGPSQQDMVGGQENGSVETGDSNLV